MYWEYGTAGHLVFSTPWPTVELKKVLSVTKNGFVFWTLSIFLSQWDTVISYVTKLAWKRGWAINVL